MKAILIRLDPVQSAALEEIKKVNHKFRSPEKMLINVIMDEYSKMHKK
jgi:hypothetical protein